MNMNTMKSSALVLTMATMLWHVTPTRDQQESKIEGEASAAAVVQDEEVMLVLGVEGMPVESFAKRYHELTGRHVSYDERAMMGRRINCPTGGLQFRRSAAVEVLGSLLLAHEIVVVPHALSSLELVRFQSLRTANDLKMHSRKVTLAALPTVPGSEIVTCVLPLKHARVDGVQRILTNFLQDHRSSFVAPHEDSNTLVITSFASTVRKMIDVSQKLDVKPVAKKKAKKVKPSAGGGGR